MLNGILKNRIQIFWLVLLGSMLILVRFFEGNLFYDPFLDFFKEEFQNKEMPQFDSFKMFFGLFFRYVINSTVSLGVIYVIFKDLNLVKFATILYVFFFVLLTSTFFGMLVFFNEPDYFILFYIRRFLIQPVLLVLFLPAFYYQKKVSRE